MYSVGIRIFRQCFYERRTGMMKRVIAVFLLLIMLLGMVSMFIACGRIGECEECHQRESLTKFRFEDGSVEWLCDDCLRIAKFFSAW